MTPLAVITWKWGKTFGPDYVNKLHRMLRRHLHVPFTFHCITDDSTGIEDADAWVDVRPMYADHAEMAAGKRSCFRRLRLLDKEMGSVFGPRILQLDLDVVFTGDVTPLFDRPEPVVLVEQSINSGRAVHNPSMFLFDAGVWHDLWARFHADPKGVWAAATSNKREHGWSRANSDMSVINDYVSMNKLRPARWTQKDGVAAYWREVRRVGGRLPPNTRAVLFYGRENPGDAVVQAKSPWIKEYWL